MECNNVEISEEEVVIEGEALDEALDEEVEVAGEGLDSFWTGRKSHCCIIRRCGLGYI